MLRPESLNDYEWRLTHDRLDKAVAETARLYLQRLQSRHMPISPTTWSQELDELGMGREPDYDVPGLPLVYALKYMPRTVISILGSLLTVVDDLYPTTVLDIGSGTGATALALDLLNAPRHINLLGIEPSGEMAAFAECSRYRARVSARYERGSVSDGSLNREFVEPFDLLVFSASLPYGFRDWIPLFAALGDYDDQREKMILVVEPEAKTDLLDSFGRRLRARGWPTETFCCHDLPELVKRDDLPLKEMQEVWKRIGSPGSTPPRTWWNPPDDRFLIANPYPSWPSLAEKRVRPGERFQVARALPYPEEALTRSTLIAPQ